MYLNLDFIAEQPGRHGGRGGLGRRAGRLRLVGARRAGAGLGVDPLVAAGERSLEGPQHPRGPLGPAARRLRVPARRRPATGQGTAAVRAGAAGRWPDSSSDGSCSSSCSTGDPAAGEVGGAVHGHRGRSRTWPCSVLSATRSSRARCCWTGFVVFAQVALGVSLIAFGGLNWALDGAAAPVAAVARLGPAMAPLGALPLGSEPAADHPAREVALRDVSFGYPGTDRAGVLRADPDGAGRILAGDRRAERGRQDHPGQAPVPAVRPGRRAPSRSTASTCAGSIWPVGAAG